MTDDTDPLELGLDLPAPGYCAVHPAVRLVTHRRSGVIRWWSLTDPAVVCTSCEGDDMERCRWCGGPLYPPPAPAYWQRSPRRAFCSSNHRLRSFRQARAAA